MVKIIQLLELLLRDLDAETRQEDLSLEGFEILARELLPETRNGLLSLRALDAVLTLTDVVALIALFLERALHLLDYLACRALEAEDVTFVERGLTSRSRLGLTQDATYKLGHRALALARAERNQHVGVRTVPAFL